MACYKHTQPLPIVHDECPWCASLVAAKAEGAAKERARVVALIELHGEGEARACDSHARACIGNRTRVPVKRMHECAAGQTRATVERILDAINEDGKKERGHG